ncbi:MAG: glycosyl hydrolase [Balneolaceae bacterium]|nr:glycosyl hydrolase [Balneolaceae bacterium]MBO6545700.1 glycosyl hydrolase [Balneolaceae bacterium]MBO6647096.1 glycosyl hydrolase [Balneolaceae bacterium]
MKRLVIGCLALFVSISISETTSAQIFGHGEETQNPTYTEQDFKDLKFRNIGPFRGGRSVAVAGHDDQPYTYYTGFTGGGVYKTTDGGNSWFNISDGFFKTGSVGAIDVADSDPNVIYVGMGETDIRGNMSAGDGMYRSTDAGKTWTYLGLGESQFIGDIEIHPENPDVVWVAAMGQIFGEDGNAERGVFKTTDGGKSWNKVLFKNNKTGAVDIAVDPNNSRILFAAMWEAHRNPWEMSSGGDGSGLFKSTDGGETWKDITQSPGLPKGLVGKIGVSVSPVNSNRVFAIVENAKGGGLFRSEDGGDTWVRVSADRNLRQRAWYYSKVIADTGNEDVVYVLNVGFWKSTDGGKTFSRIRTPHGDHHDLWIASDNPQRMVIGDDGGGQVTFNGGQGWSSYYTSATAQIYQVTTDNQFPYMIYGAQQDNSTFAIRNRTSGSGITERDWWPVAGGESGYIAPDPEDPNVTFGGSYGGYLNKYDAELGLSDRIDVWPDNPMGAGAKDLKYRFQWTFPIIFSPHNPDVLYATSQHVHRSTNEGMSWEEISPDLTRNDTTKQDESGGPITKDDTSVEYYNTIFTFVESPIEPGLLWAGSDDGLIHISRNNGESWENVTPRGLPEAMISILDASHHDPGTAYFAATRYKFNDFQPMIYKTTNYGRSWEKITNGIPAMDFTRAVREDPNKAGLLYAGTETGLYISFDAGDNWQSFQLNLPATPITDLAVHKRDKDLIVATQGRSFWVFDDLPVLHQISEEITEAEHHLFDPEDTYLFGGGGNFNPAGTNGQNPTPGAVVYYMLGDDVSEEIRLEFLDMRENVIQTYSSKKDDRDRPVKESPLFYEEEDQRRSSVVSDKVGLNKFAWDLEYPGVTDLDGRQILWAGNTSGPDAVPGTYKVRMYVGEEMVGEQDFEVMKDPRLTDVTQQDLIAQFELVQTINAKLDTTHKAINRIKKVRDEINELMGEAESNEELQEKAKAMLNAITAIEEELYQTKAEATQDVLNFPIKLNNKLAALKGTVATGFGRPTDQQYAVFEELGATVDVQLEKLQAIWNGEYENVLQELENPSVPIEN